MSAEETVFCIPGLRLIILSYYLENKIIQKNNTTCIQYFNNKIGNIIDNIIYYVIYKIYGHGITLRV